ncbi:carbohydrate-binding module family 20 domain-containing protein [Amnibacterium soli]|uniref:Alpha-amylase n=1 Tax=Amnibacterium soli TaxID=1282736 RepID=A0ABP8YXD0_9MICO
MNPTRPPKPFWRRRRVRAATAGVALLAAGALTASVVLPATAAPEKPGRSSATPVLANLFEWNWPSVAKECTTQLGPAGYAGVQVAPPQDSTKRTALGNGSDDVLHPWWEVYQPADYRLTSRMGTAAQFRAMVKTCRAAGVKVYVDAVLNHMTGQGTTSYGGEAFTKYSYPGVYSPSDFHSYPANCPVPPASGSSDRMGSIRDFNDYRQVFDCELVGLSDLDTSKAKVRSTLAAYLNTLLSYGVSGFRVDAAKHVGQSDLAAIQSRLRRTVDGTRPYFALEVGAGSPGRISPAAFTGQGQVLGFDYTTAIQNAFTSYDDDGTPRNDGNIGDLEVFGEAGGLLPSANELVFIQNHDTERNGSSLNYKDPNNLIATQFMLAYPYGTPQVYAGFTFGKDTNQSPPSTADGRITDTDCGSAAWSCTDRQLGVKGMVRFHNRVGQAPVRNWYDDGANLIAFSRGNVGFFSTNNAAKAKTVTVRTGLPSGRYCDVIHGVKRGGACSGPTVRVRANGTATITVGAYDSVAFTRSDRL